MCYPPEEQPGVAGDLPETLQGSCYLQEEKPGVAGDQSQTVQGSCYPQEEQPGVAGIYLKLYRAHTIWKPNLLITVFMKKVKKKKPFKSLNKTIM